MNENDLLKALGPLASLYSDPTVTEIVVDAHDRVYVDRGAQLEDVQSSLNSPEALRAVIDSILALGDITLSPEKTIGEAHFPDGSRFMAMIPPTALSGPCFVLRKLTKPLEWEDIFKFKAITREAYDLLQDAIRAHVNILVAGGAGSGKTTIANRLVECIPADERVVVAESLQEMRVRHPRCIHLEASGSTVSFEELVVKASCMRADWLVVGEFYGPETARALQVLGHGHTGLATVHANSAEDALAYLESLCLMANLGLGLGEIRRLIASAIRLITFQERLQPDGRRRITHIVELCGVENDRYVLQPLFRYNAPEDKLEATGAKPGWK